VRRVHAVDLPEAFDRELQSWDLAFNDWTPPITWPVACAAPRVPTEICWDLVRERLEFPETVAAIKKTTLKWP
jgi:hypothetical protein